MEGTVVPGVSAVTEKLDHVFGVEETTVLTNERKGLITGDLG